MRIINILEIINGIPNYIKSFPIYKEQLSQDIVEEVEKEFIKCIEHKTLQRPLSENEKEEYLDNGTFDNMNGYELYIIWSYIK